MSESYIPSQDGPALEWMQNFSARINANVALYMLTLPDAANVEKNTPISR